MSDKNNWTDYRDASWLKQKNALRMNPKPVEFTDSTGVESIVVFIRRIYEELTYHDDWVKRDRVVNGEETIEEQENRSPLLKFCWQVIRPEKTPTKGAEAQPIDKLTEQLVASHDGPNMDFASLYRRRDITETLFTREPEFPLMSAVKVRKQGGDWRPMRMANRETRAKWSELVVDTAKDGTDIQQILFNQFEIRGTEESPGQLVWEQAFPHFIRFRVTTHVHKTLEYDALRELRTIEFKTRQPFLPPTYVLVAVVKLRSSAQGEDKIRVYSTNGHEIVPPQGTERPSRSSEWSVADPDQTFVLLYVRSTEMPDDQAPEVHIQNTRETDDLAGKQLEMDIAEQEG